MKHIAHMYIIESKNEYNNNIHLIHGALRIN